MRPSLASLIALLCCALLCACATDPATTDTDEDGFMDAFEDQIGTDKELADTDGDGTADAIEYLTFFSPRSDDDKPYTGNYPRGPLMSTDDWNAHKEEEGSSWNEEGEISKGWIHDDQHDQELKLKRFYGNVILVDLSSEWCGPCRAATETLEEKYQARKDQGFLVVQVLMDNMTGDGPPDTEGWIEEYGLTFPVLSDFDREVADRYVPAGGGWYIPNFTIIDRNHELETWYSLTSGFDGGEEGLWEHIDELLDEPAPEIDYPLPDNAADLYESLGLTSGVWFQPDAS